MLQSDRWDPWLIGIVAGAVCGLAILAALGYGALAPRLARWKARKRAQRREVHCEALRAALRGRPGHFASGLAPPGDVARRHDAAVGQRPPEPQVVADADARSAPLGGVIEGEAIAGGAGGPASDPPAAIGASGKDRGIPADRIPDVAPPHAGADLAPAGLADVESGAQPGAVEAEGGGDQAPGGPDGRPRAARADEHHRSEVGRVIVAGQLAGRDQLIAVVEVGLVAGMAGGDDEPCGRPPEPAPQA